MANCTSRLLINLCTCPKLTTHVLVSQALRFAEKLARGVALCRSEASLHPFLDKKVDFQTCIKSPALRGLLLLGRPTMQQ